MKPLSTPPKPRCRVWQFPTESLTQSVNMKGLVPSRFSTIVIIIHITTSFQKPYYYHKHSHTEYELSSIPFNRSNFFMSKFFIIFKLDNHSSRDLFKHNICGAWQFMLMVQVTVSIEYIERDHRSHLQVF